MLRLDIRLNGADSVREFVSIANRFPFTISLSQGRAMVDGKSILGVFSLDQNQPIVLSAFSDHHSELLEALEKYAC